MFSYDEQAIKRIVQQLMNFEESIKISANAESDVHSLIAYLRYECTILFHLGEVKYVFSPRRKEAVLTPCYLYSPNEYESLVSQLAMTVQKIRDQICKTPSMLERELLVHDAFCKSVQYADDGDQSHSIVGPLLFKRGVCDGISKAAKVVLQECGIKSHVISGMAQTGATHQKEPHAWNIVQMNNEWYHLDITFDNTISNKSIRYDYFNVCDQEIFKDHTIGFDSPYQATRCLAEQDYYSINGRAFCDLDGVRQYIARCINERKTHIQLRISPMPSLKELEGVFVKELSKRSNGKYVLGYNEIRGVCCWDIEYN